MSGSVPEELGPDSILDGTKAALGIESDYTAFDRDIMMHINTVFSDLHQLGIGPDEGFEISDASTTWDDYLDGDMLLNQVPTYMYLRVRLLFDPPATSFHIQAMQEQIQALEWRLNVKREEETWVSPNP